MYKKFLLHDLNFYKNDKLERIPCINCNYLELPKSKENFEYIQLLESLNSLEGC